MGLFSFNSKKNFYDLLGLQINETTEAELKETDKTADFTDYSTDIKENFKIVDTATFRFFGHQKDLSGKSSFNLIFSNKGQSLTINKIKEIVNAIANEYGKDRRGNGKWTPDDDRAISTYWEGREWIIDIKGNSHKELIENSAQINLIFNLDDGIDFSILGANNLVKR
ncbi:MAG: hypothetical protein IM577_05920 [Chitinophagaceae bacterium]|jgi:hypothetical protein|nr:hypothetical protein [Chitinophagaceae bacterium]